MNAAILSQITLAKNIKDAQVTNSLNGNDAQSTYRLNQAKLASAKAAVEIARRNINDAYLYAPISGVVAVKSKQVGEFVATTDQIYYLLGEGGLEVTANVSEIDIAKVAVGNSTSITLDAYGPDVVFNAHVASIDPAETVINGVSTYKVTFVFDTPDERLRSGMTANIKIATQNRTNVIVVPLRAVSTKDGSKIVHVQVGEQENEVVVRLGLKGDDGMVEVLDGLKEGDIVLVD
jgi:RND family efflux transporter MFP subunit